MIDQEKVGKFIADLRKEKGLTQDDLAEKMFVGREAISKWERGVCIPGQTILLSLSEEFNVSINEILYGESYNSEFIPRNINGCRRVRRKTSKPCGVLC